MNGILLFGEKSYTWDIEFKIYLVLKIHTSCKILSKFCQHFRGTKAHMGKLFGISIFLSEKSRIYRHYQNKNRFGFTSSSYINPKIAQNQGKNEILHFMESHISVLLQIGSLSFQAS